MQREILFECLVSLQILHKKNESFVYLYQKELLGCFSEDIKMCPSNNVLNWYTSNWLLFNICVDSMGLNTNVNCLIFRLHYCRQNIREQNCF